jgi:hypothetical protein
MFTFTERVFRALSLVDIRHQVIPTHNAAFGITLRATPHVEPAVHAIGSTATRFKVQRLPRFDRPRQASTMRGRSSGW